LWIPRKRIRKHLRKLLLPQLSNQKLMLLTVNSFSVLMEVRAKKRDLDPKKRRRLRI
jgi:hypothetical protein